MYVRGEFEALCNCLYQVKYNIINSFCVLQSHLAVWLTTSYLPLLILCFHQVVQFGSGWCRVMSKTVNAKITDLYFLTFCLPSFGVPITVVPYLNVEARHMNGLQSIKYSSLPCKMLAQLAIHSLVLFASLLLWESRAEKSVQCVMLVWCHVVLCSFFWSGQGLLFFWWTELACRKWPAGSVPCVSYC